MKFDSEKIVYSSEKMWDELMSITFVKGDSHLSFNSLVYEDEIGIEFNDQINFITVPKNNVEYELSNDQVQIILKEPLIQNNLPDLNFEISFPNTEMETLKKALAILVKEPD